MLSYPLFFISSPIVPLRKEKEDEYLHPDVEFWTCSVLTVITKNLDVFGIC